MRWPFKKRPNEACFNIGQYRLDMSIEDQPGLHSLSKAEVAALGPKISFKGEQILHAPGALFQGTEWSIILGVVDGRVYKVAAQWWGKRAEAGTLTRQISIDCTKLYGNSNGGLWDTSDGNVVLQSSNLGEQGVGNVFATSSKVSSFERV